MGKSILRRDKEPTEIDRAEIDRFVVYLRLVHEAVKAGCTTAEASNAIYPDVYEAPDGARET